MNRTSWKTCIMPSSKTQPAHLHIFREQSRVVGSVRYLESMERDLPVLCLFGSDQIPSLCGVVVNKLVTAITHGFASWIFAMVV